MKRIVEIIEILDRKYKVKAWREKPFKLLIGTVISQRTKDETTEKAVGQLFRVANTPEKILKLSEKRIAKLIYPAGFYRQKSRRIKEISRIVLEKYRGRVPDEREELMQLPGVGSKTASIVLAYSFGVPTIAVDTHVNRISQRLGLVPNGCKPEKTQELLEKIVPEKLQIKVNHLFVLFGQNICRPVRPYCNICPIYRYCKYEKKEYYRKLPLR